jgi:hypothetical protein
LCHKFHHFLSHDVAQHIDHVLIAIGTWEYHHTEFHLFFFPAKIGLDKRGGFADDGVFLTDSQQTPMNRRDLIKKIGLASAGIALAPYVKGMNPLLNAKLDFVRADFGKDFFGALPLRPIRSKALGMPMERAFDMGHLLAQAGKVHNNENGRCELRFL